VCEDTDLKINGVAVIVAVVVVILVVVLLSVKSNIQSASIVDEPIISDSVLVQNAAEGENYYMDENGKKHYILSVEDKPNFDG